MTLIQKLDEAVTIFTVPFKRFGLIPIGGRSTAVKLASGKIVLFASHPNDDATAKTLEEMGETVSHIIALDAVHHMFLSDYLKVYPNAKLVGPKGLVSKRSDLKFDIVQPDTSLDAELAQEFKAVALTGHPNEDIVWLHTPSKTLIEADALFNLPCEAQKSGVFAYVFPNFLLSHMAPNTVFHRTVVKGFSKGNPSAFADAAKVVDGWDFNRLIPCHGEVIPPAGSGSTTNAAKAAWRNAYSSVMGEHSKSD